MVLSKVGAIMVSMHEAYFMANHVLFIPII
jgi:hypothetical protein